jgi:predicted nucleic acid-binding protein
VIASGEISTRSQTPGWIFVPKQRLARGILDTSVVIDLERIDPAMLPEEVAVTAITMAELAAGPHATTDPAERARRQDRLQRAEAAFDALAFDTAAARAYGLIYAAVIAQGRKARGARANDLVIAAVAAAHGIPLVTRNPEDFSGLVGIVTVVEV